MYRRLRQLALVAGGFLALSGCSIPYEVDVRLINGAIHFSVHQQGLFWGRKDEVAQISSVRVAPIDDYDSPAWEIRSIDYNGLTLPSVRYGATPLGFDVKVRPKRLDAGKVYIVDIGALGGYGSEHFVIAAGGPTNDGAITYLTENDTE